MVNLGMGMMRLPILNENDFSSVDYEQVNEMVDLFMENGFNHFDTAYPYHEGLSEVAFRKCVVERYPRESFKIADKIPTWTLTSEEDNQKFVDIMLERLGTDYFDVLLIHNINEAFLEIAKNCNSFDYIKKMKENGVKNTGMTKNIH